MQGAPPLASPAFNRLRHLQTFSNMNPAEGLPGWSPANLTAVVPGGGLNPSGTCSPCPGGEDHLKRRRRVRRIVPSPPAPLSLAAGTAHRKAVLSVLRRTAGSHAQGTRLAGSVSAAGGLMPGRRGEAPGEINFGTPPSRREGGRGGWGQESKLKARLAGSKQGTPPRRARGSPPFPSAARIQSRGCKGQSPLHKKTKNLPLPAGKGAGGGWGQESKLKARLAGSKQGKPPPPPGAWFAPISQCRPGSALGDARGEAPCIRKQKISPFPGGEGGWGDGG